MNASKKEKYRVQLREMASRLQGNAASLQEQARESSGGAGNLSTAPLHLADLGTESYTQELGATLFENEAYLFEEVLAGLDRLDRDTFGVCEECSQKIPQERIEAIPYARHCTSCAEKLQTGRGPAHSPAPRGKKAR